MKNVVLRRGKEKALSNKHHWIFSGAVLNLPEFTDGEILPVYSEGGKLLGSGYFNRKAKIIGRMLTFDAQDPLDMIKKHIDSAIDLRKALFDQKATTAYRLINAEGDFIPGLIVDRYGSTLVLQVSTLGIDRLKHEIVDYLRLKLNPTLIYEKSQVPSRREEGLNDAVGVLYGELSGDIEILENGLKFFVSITEGQKTGFFLDHREMRQRIRGMANQKRVLNCFSYTGGFSVYAAAGGALAVDSVDISEKAVAYAERNMALNGSGVNNRFIAEDVFQFLRNNDLHYDLVILDPPAFAKKQRDVVQGCRGYKDINRVAMQKMPAKSYLLTCSCSHYVDEVLFQKVVFQAAVEAGREVKIIGRHDMASDHPINICHPESDYLKSLLVYIE